MKTQDKRALEHGRLIACDDVTTGPGAAPTPAPDAADRLQRMVRCLRAGEVVPAADALALATGLEAYLSGNVSDLARALNVNIKPGQRTRHTLAALAERDRQIILAARYCHGDSVASVADQLATAFGRYQSGAWRFDRLAVDCPPRHRGRVTEHLFFAMKAHPTALSAGRVRQILSRGEHGCS